MKLIKFEQDNCTPCKMLKNFLEKDLKVEVDETVNIASGGPEAIQRAVKYGIMTTPVLLLVDKEGNEIERAAGVGQTKVRNILAKRGLI